MLSTIIALFRRSQADLLFLVALAISAILLMFGAYAGQRAITLTMATPESVLPLRNFNDLERFPNEGGFYRWTTGRSLVQPANPGGLVLLSWWMTGGPGGPTPLQLTAGTYTVVLRVLPAPRTYRLLLPPQAGERIPFEFQSPTSVIADRTLGVMLGNLKMTGSTAAPAAVITTLLVASLCFFLLLRQAMWRPAPSAGAAFVLQLLVAGVLFGGGWVYGLATPLLSVIALGSIAIVAVERLGRMPAMISWFGQAPTGAERTSIGILPPRVVLAACGVVFLALLIRLPWLSAADPVGDLELAGRRMFYLWERGLSGSYTRGGDYLPLRLFLLWGLGQFVRPLGGDFFAPLPTVTLVLIKLPQLIADLVVTAIIVLWGRRWVSLRWAAIVASLYAAAPPVWMNVAWWGQVDALLMLPLVLAVLLLGRAQGRWSWLCWGLAMLIKAQAIIFVPLLAIVTLRRYGSHRIIQGVLIAGAIIVLGCIPLLIAGQGFPLTDAYLGSVGRFPRTTYGAYNLWHLVLGGTVTEDHNLFIGPLSYRSAGIVLLGCAVSAIGITLWRGSGEQERVRAAALLSLSFFLLPTQIHERYLFLSLPLLALWATYNRRLIGVLTWYCIAATMNIVLILSGFWPAAKDVLEGYPELTLAIAVVNLSLFGLLLLQAVWAPAQRSMRDAGISSSPTAPYQSE